jgi:hypothetical protein
LSTSEDGLRGWTLLVNPDTAAVIAVNRSGVAIRRLAEGRRTTDDTAGDISRHCRRASGSVCRAGVAMLTRFSKQGLIGREIPVRDSGQAE